MAGKRNRKDVDAEVDLHGLTAEQLRTTLQQRWPGWRNLHSVRIVHGQGTVLKPEVVRWCVEMGIPYLPDSHNLGAIRIFPQQRTLPDNSLGNTLKESGLRLTPEQEAYLRDPQTIERARQEERKRQIAEEQRKRTQERIEASKKRQDEALWQAEMTRLGVLERKKGVSSGDAKPRPPLILPPVRLKFEEGYWKAELSRVADTDTETLQKQKKTGLDKLAPPMKEEKEEAAKGASKEAAAERKRQASQRDLEAERALFEAEMERLGEFDGFQIRRSKSE